MTGIPERMIQAASCNASLDSKRQKERPLNTGKLLCRGMHATASTAVLAPVAGHAAQYTIASLRLRAIYRFAQCEVSESLLSTLGAQNQRASARTPKVNQPLLVQRVGAAFTASRSLSLACRYLVSGRARSQPDVLAAALKVPELTRPELLSAC